LNYKTIEVLKEITTEPFVAFSAGCNSYSNIQGNY